MVGNSREMVGRFMPLLGMDGKDVELNDEGFMGHPQEWCEEVARAFALLDKYHGIDGRPLEGYLLPAGLLPAFPNSSHDPQPLQGHRVAAWGD
jgi:hypothetical protein